MDLEKEHHEDGSPSDKTIVEQVNIEMDRKFYGENEVRQPEETTAPFINRNQS